MHKALGFFAGQVVGGAKANPVPKAVYGSSCCMHQVERTHSWTCSREKFQEH